MAASTNVHNLLAAVRVLAPGVATGPGGDVLGPLEIVTDNSIQDAMALTYAVTQMRAGLNPYTSDETLMEQLTTANWYETTNDTILSVTMTMLKLLVLIPEAQRVG